jgi:hypothetical protein
MNMNGDFLRDLSEGIFERLRELRQEQEAKDIDQKKQTIGLLASMAERAEPESVPLLMSHLGNVIGVKGKLKGFWNAFSGMPDTSIETQLGTKLNEINSSLTGPETARQARETYKQNLLQPYREQGTRPRTVSGLNWMSPPDLQGKIVFRDPLKEAAAVRQFEAEQLDKRLANTAWIEEQKERLRATLEEKKQRAADEKLTQQQKLAFSKDLANQIKFYRSNGVKDPNQARRLALNDFGDFANQLGYEIPPLTSADNSALDLVNAKIERLQRSGSGVGVGGASWWRQPQLRTWVEYELNGETFKVEASQMKTDSLSGQYILPPGARLTRIYTDQLPTDGTGQRPGAGGVSNKITPELIQGSIDNEIKKGTALPEIVKKLRALPAYAANKEIFEGVIRARNLERPPARTDFTEPSFASPEGVAGGVLSGGDATSEQVRKQVQLDVMRNEILWLKTRKNDVQKQLQMAPGIVQRSEMENTLKDLDRRIEYAENEYQKAGGQRLY